MATASGFEVGVREFHSILEMYGEQRWYAAYHPRERFVAQEFGNLAKIRATRHETGRL